MTHDGEDVRRPSPVGEPGLLQPAPPATASPSRFAELVIQSQPRIRRLLARILGNIAELDDLVQETYLRAWRGLRSFRGDCNPNTWLTQIAVNVARNWIRDRKPASVELDDQRCVDPSTRSPDPAVLLDAYQQALDQLPDDQRAILILRESEGLTYDQIAQVLDCPKGTVMSRLHRARGRILDLLHDRLEELIP